MHRLACGIVAVVLASTAGALAAKRPRLESRWRDRDIVIDGDNGDWAGPLAAVDTNYPITAAVANDREFLFLVLSTGDAAMRRQIMRQGLIVWFDPAGGDKKHLGIKFPVGLALTMAGKGGRGRPGPDQPDEPNRVDPPNRLEIYGPAKNDAHSFVLDAAPGITVKVGEVAGYFVYELKVPLASTPQTPYAIGGKPGSVIGLGLETPKSEAPRRGGGFGEGGRGIGGMGRRGGTGGRRDGEFDRPKPLKAWASVELGHQHMVVYPRDFRAEPRGEKWPTRTRIESVQASPRFLSPAKD